MMELLTPEERAKAGISDRTYLDRLDASLAEQNDLKKLVGMQITAAVHSSVAEGSYTLTLEDDAKKVYFAAFSSSGDDATLTSFALEEA